MKLRNLAAGFLLFSLSSFAAVLLDRGLPSSVNVNNSAGANRSNVSWAQQGQFINGDSFTAGNWLVDSITVWGVGASSDYSNFQLYLSVNNGTFAPASASVAVSPAFYQPSSADACSTVNGVNYQNPGGSCSPIFSVVFSGLNLALSSGDLVYFAPDATISGNCGGNDLSGCLYVHATNAANAGTPQDQSNNRYVNFDTAAANGDPADCDSGGTGGICNGGWDKSSDINVLVEGRLNEVPEPSTWALLIAGLGALAARRRA